MNFSSLGKLADQSIIQAFTVLKQTTHRTSKVAAEKNIFSSVNLIGATCFNKCFLFYLIIGRHCFS